MPAAWSLSLTVCATVMASGVSEWMQRVAA